MTATNLMHYTMTIQSIWNREPSAAATVSGLINPTKFDNSRQVMYQEIYNRAVKNWHQSNSGISLGKVAVLMFTLDRDSVR